MQRASVLGLFATSALAASMAAGAAFAQTAGDAGAVGEVVVTASRRADTVHNVPLSISAVTPQQFEAQGLKTAQDLSRVVPSLSIGTSNGTNGGASVAITLRGIAAGNATAATTGVYVDDVSLTQRNTNNPLAGGLVLPQLFDLERVEVLRGPQGTLYGGSSMGGAVRFITPQPSFTKYSARIMGEVSTTEDGGVGYDSGLAVGGPIVQDKLAFRGSASFRKDAGYLDHVSRFTGAVLAGGEDTNTAKHTTYHLSLAWRPAEQATVTLSYLYTQSKFRDVDSFWEDIPQYTSRTGAGTPLQTFGPYTMFGPYKTGLNTNIGDRFYTSDAQIKPLLGPNSHRLSVPSLTFDYAFDKMNFKAILAYTTTKNNAYPNFTYADIESQARLPPFIPNLLVYNAVFSQEAVNRDLSGEARFSSNNPDSRLSWVAGVYYNYARQKSTALINGNLGDLLAAANGVPFPPSFNGEILNFPQKLNETQIAAYGEATFAVTEKLKATAGVRITRDELNVLAFQGGALFGLPPGVINQTVATSLTESPITPKFGLQYIFDANTNVYLNAAKGFRSGGANNDLRGTPNCAADIARVFPGGFPTAFQSDDLWSYEAGAKTRAWGGRATINASLFRIDWKGVPTQITLACGQPVIVGGADVRSQGGDVQADVRLFPGFTASLAAGYTDAKYQSTLLSGGAGSLPLWNSGDQVPNVPKWTVSLSGQYDFSLGSYRGYIRADYQYASSTLLSTQPGTSQYAPDNFSLPARDIVSARAGVTVKQVDVSVFVNNLFNSQDLLSRSGFAPGTVGRIGCTTAACTTFSRNAIGAQETTYRPRTFGITASYRY